MEVKQREVWMCNLKKVGGSIQHGYRPVVVIQNDVGNKFSPTVIVTAITSVNKKNNMPTHVKIEKGILDEDSVIITEQILTIEKNSLKKKLGILNKDFYVNHVEAALGVSIGLHNEE